MARLILVRHAESVANAERRFTRDGSEPLSARGREEARVLGLLLRERFAPVALYASPFERALETARLVGESLALVPCAVEDLREQDFGALRGRPYAEYGSDPAARGIGRWTLRPPGGETLSEVAARAGAALDELARRHAGEEVVVVSHGGVMAALRGHLAGTYDDEPVGTPNAAGYLVVRSEGRYEGPLPLFADEAPLSHPPRR